MQVEVIETTGGNIFNQLLFSISSLITLAALLAKTKLSNNELLAKRLAP